MIDKALRFLTTELNTYLDLQNGVAAGGDPIILLTNVSDNVSGGVAIPLNKLGVSLINIEEEKVFKEQQTNFKNADGEFEQYNPEIKLNLYMLVCANFENENDDKYEQGLKQLSRVISFFQGKNVFTPDNSPALDTVLKKLIVELYSYSFEQQYNFWTVLGVKYMPSVLYKVRLVAFQEKRLLNQNSPITAFELQLSNK